MPISRSLLRVFAVFVLVSGVLAVPASGLANRVFVSARSGNNANFCDNIATPCQTLAGAVAQLNAGGEAIVLDSGGYGPVTITKALTIEAPPGVTAFIHPPSGDAITVNAGSGDTVILRGLVLNGGSGDGIKVSSVGILRVEDCSISGLFYGIEMAAAGRLDVRNTVMTACFIGVQIANTAGTVTASFDHCHLDGNVSGFRSAPVSPGQSRTTAISTTANDNDQFGWINGASSDGVSALNLEFCSGSNNTLDGLFAVSANASSSARVSNSVFANNSEFGLSQLGSSTLESRGNNTVKGNASGQTNGTIMPFSGI